MKLPVLLDTVRLFVPRPNRRARTAVPRGTAAAVYDRDGWLRLRQMLGILLGSAIKFTARRSQLETETRTGCPESVLILASLTPVSASPATRSPSFQAFTQVDQSSRRAFGGTGLGRSSPAISPSRSAAIEVDSSEGKAPALPSRCRCTSHSRMAPRTEAAAGSARLPDAIPTCVPWWSMTTRSAASCWSTCFRLAMLSPIVSESGADALWQVDEQSYDLVFLDVHITRDCRVDVVGELQRPDSGPALSALVCHHRGCTKGRPRAPFRPKDGRFSGKAGGCHVTGQAPAPLDPDGAKSHDCRWATIVDRARGRPPQGPTSLSSPARRFRIPHSSVIGGYHVLAALRPAGAEDPGCPAPALPVARRAPVRWLAHRR